MMARFALSEGWISGLKGLPAANLTGTYKYWAGKMTMKQLVITVVIFCCQRLLQETINKPTPRQQQTQ
jgi:hypothetical protein